MRELRGLLTVLSLAVMPVVPALAVAATEVVQVQRVTGHSALVTRKNGEAFLITTGIGCPSLWRYEGKTVLIESPGLFLGIGSSLVLPKEKQSCRVWSSQRLGWELPRPGFRLAPRVPEPTVDPAFVSTLQQALKIVGYDPGPVDGVLGFRTLAALDRYRQSKRYPITEDGLRKTLWALTLDVLADDRDAAATVPVALGLMGFLDEGSKEPVVSPPARFGGGLSGCEEGHWVRRVMSSGRLVELEDGSLWEINAYDRFDTMLWLILDDISVCGDTLVNTDRGEAVNAKRTR